VRRFCRRPPPVPREPLRRRPSSFRRRPKRLGTSRHLCPDRGSVGAPKPEHISADLAVAREIPKELDAGLIVDEPIGVEGPDIRCGRVGGPAEHQSKLRIGRQRGRAGRSDAADVDAFLKCLEQPREGKTARVFSEAQTHVGTWMRS
jgi:hypothetical protein